ncbi:hypothetical protein Unana1_03087 [Umbelopsis nana]
MSIRLPLKDLQICLYSYDSKTSLLDLENRPREEAGRYLRWGHITIRFLGYTEEEAPEFLVLGVASATKYGRRAGNALFQDVVIGTRRPNANRSVARDLDGGIIALAILQGAMHGDLLRVIKEQSFGEQLLRSVSNPDVPEYDFECAHAYLDSPVFLMPAGPTDKGIKHHLDVTPVSPNFRPMTTCSILRLLKKVGKDSGIEQTVTSGVFRRTVATRLVYDTQMPTWKISRSLQQFSGNKNLVRQTYRATNRSIDRADLWFGPGSSSAAVMRGIQQIATLNRAIYQRSPCQNIRCRQRTKHPR